MTLLSEQPRVPAGDPKGGQWTDKGFGPYGVKDDAYLYELNSDPAFTQERSNETYETLQRFWPNNDVVNDTLRGTLDPDAGYIGQPKSIVAAMDEAFKSANRSTADATVYRGVDLTNMNVEEGSTFSDKGYACTSMDQPLVTRWAIETSAQELEQRVWKEGRAGKSVQSRYTLEAIARARGSEPAVMAIRMPKGTKYLPGDAEMAEIIPNRGAKFKVLKITRRPGKVTLIDMEMIP